MSDDTLKITSNHKEIQAKFQELQNRVKNIKPALREIGHVMQNYVDENFETEGENSGEKWEAWKDEYAERRAKMGRGEGRIMTLNNELREDISTDVTNDSVIVGTGKEYARIHNEGGDVKKRGGGKFEMPKRTFMAWTPKLEELVADELYVALKFEDYIDKENARIKFLKGE